MKLFDAMFGKKPAPGGEYEAAASIIEDFVEGRSDPWAWDDFTSIRKKDPFLESVRAKCVRIPSEHPPRDLGRYCDDEGLEVLRGLARSLREKSPERSGAPMA